MKNYFCILAVLLLFRCYAENYDSQKIQEQSQRIPRFFQKNLHLPENQNTWQYHWQKGYNHFFESQYQEAALEFDQAILLMSEEEQNQYPYVLVYRAESNFFLGLCEQILQHNERSIPNLEKFKRALQDIEKALNSDNIAENEKLICGIRRVEIFIRLGDLNAAQKAHRKYVAEVKLFSQYDYFNGKTSIRSVLIPIHSIDIFQQNIDPN